ncbi:MAG: ATP-binding cassette domain-containing protein [Lachnospiraceae bacterium]
MCVCSDEKWVTFILGQLISNAVKYHNTYNPILKFTAEKTVRNIILMVEDNGIGISKADLPRIFERGFTGSDKDYNLLDTLTIGENIALAPIIGNMKSNQISSNVEAVAAALEIRHLLDKFPYQVSGGERQRCACARALICSPRLILADEPTGALDSKSSQILLDTLSKMNKERNATIIMVTHDIFSASYCSRILFLRDGKLFDELLRGEKSRREFFGEILDVVTVLGGDVKDVG